MSSPVCAIRQNRLRLRGERERECLRMCSLQLDNYLPTYLCSSAVFERTGVARSIVRSFDSSKINLSLFSCSHQPTLSLSLSLRSSASVRGLRLRSSNSRIRSTRPPKNHRLQRQINWTARFKCKQTRKQVRIA